jgi:hypothetical protein
LSRRVSLPAADDLFRPTVVPDPEELSAADPPGDDERGAPARPAEQKRPPEAAAVPEEPEKSRAPSGRVRHDEKMTVYVTSDELLDIEHARLTLRRNHALAVDRGRLVREAVAIALADFDENGAASVLVQRLNQS